MGVSGPSGFPSLGDKETRGVWGHFPLPAAGIHGRQSDRAATLTPYVTTREDQTVAAT